MNHPTEEDLILHYYAEAENLLPLEQHLGECDECRARYSVLERTLNSMAAFEAPERNERYAAEVWHKLESQLPQRKPFWLFTTPWRWASAGVAFAGLLVLAFLAGRSYPGLHPGPGVASALPARDRVLLVAVGDHLERSQNMLTELANAPSATRPLDISFEQQRAADLLDENRLYRQTAVGAGDDVMAGVLDELERILLEIEHAPPEMSPTELEDLRLRLRTEGILFKLRVLGSNVRNQQESAPRRFY
jgi:hypothetical protein